MNRFFLPGLALLLLCTTNCRSANTEPAGGALPPSETKLTAASPAQTGELRGMWVVRSSIVSPSGIRQVVATAKSHHFNALFVQVRGRGDAYYQSELEPRAEELSGQPADFDPLAETLTLAHAAGIQVHAWMNTCYVWGGGKMPKASTHILNTHQDWLARDAQNHFRVSQGPQCEGAFLTPANLAARKHIHDVFVDVATRYPVDGIHFDYIRYPNIGYDYSDAALSRFKAEIVPGLAPAQVANLHKWESSCRIAYAKAFPDAWRDFRRRQVTDMVGEISHDIKAVKPNMIISAAVFADRADAYSLRGQDWNTWLAKGYVDAVLPMAYGSSTARVSRQIADAVSCANAAGRYVFAGLGAWHIPADSTIGKIEAARTLGARGICLFSYGGITKDGTTTAYVDKVCQRCFTASAGVPDMPWMKPATARSASAPIQVLGQVP